MKDIIIISVGGSLIVPDEIDVEFLKRLRNLILSYVNEGFKFVVICGGGRTARRYQEAAENIVDLTRDDLDWLGIHGTRINAHLLRTIFRDEAHPKIITNPKKDIDFDGNGILIGAGWKPGFSTDYDAVLLAEKCGADKLINLTDIDYVYDEDPDKNKNARRIEKASWQEFRNIIPDEWHPGLSSPFDPIASKKAEEMGLEVAIINGSSLDRLDNYLSGDKFKGTLIK